MCIQSPLKPLIEKSHSTNAANRCYAEWADVLSYHKKFLKAWVDSPIAAKKSSNNGIASSGQIPEDCNKMQDDKHQMPPATEPEKTHFDALRGRKESPELDCPHRRLRDFQSLLAKSTASRKLRSTPGPRSGRSCLRMKKIFCYCRN